MYYTDFLTEKQQDFIEHLTDDLGLDCIDNIEWTFGYGWDADPESMSFYYIGFPKNYKLTGRVKVTVSLSDIEWWDDIRVEINGEEMTVKQSSQYLAGMIRTAWERANRGTAA